MSQLFKDREYRRAWYKYVLHKFFVWLYKWRTLKIFVWLFECFKGKALTADVFFREIMTLPKKKSIAGIDGLRNFSNEITDDVPELVKWARKHRLKKIFFVTHPIVIREVLALFVTDDDKLHKIMHIGQGESITIDNNLEGVESLEVSLWKDAVNSFVLYQLDGLFPDRDLLVKSVKPIKHYKVVIKFEK